MGEIELVIAQKGEAYMVVWYGKMRKSATKYMKTPLLVA
jgi:hypothetical protein